MARKKTSLSGHDRDLLGVIFNLLKLTILMLIILMVTIQVQEPSKGRDDKNEFVISAQWTDGTDDDIDLWLLTPNGAKIGYRSRQADGVALENDDVGNQFVTDAAGQRTFDPSNYESIGIRKTSAGTYVCNLHFYRQHNTATPPESVIVILMQINPYRIVAKQTVVLSQEGEERTAFVFDVNGSSSVVSVRQDQTPFILSQ